MNNKELAQWCIHNNNMNQKRAEDIIIFDMQKFDELRNFMWLCDLNNNCGYGMGGKCKDFKKE